MKIEILIKGLTNRITTIDNLTKIQIKNNLPIEELVSYEDFPLDSIKELSLGLLEYKFISDTNIVIVKGEDLKAIIITNQD
ncbi:hypothetical protein [Streptococcus sp. DD04]|uniref:hypothetical protein n=1 Tax=Streptococcus sp. DD04 TaxID=1776578 RepID=UPI000785024F|nr:hypothetical protein [Streptococcus sp. DD04]KXT65067.1 hypothetical protein STRDD04_01043 [Streptococcus sp. DD04]